MVRYLVISLISVGESTKVSLAIVERACELGGGRRQAGIEDFFPLTKFQLQSIVCPTPWLLSTPAPDQNICVCRLAS